MEASAQNLKASVSDLIRQSVFSHLGPRNEERFQQSLKKVEQVLDIYEGQLGKSKYRAKIVDSSTKQRREQGNRGLPILTRKLGCLCSPFTRYTGTYSYSTSSSSSMRAAVVAGADNQMP